MQHNYNSDTIQHQDKYSLHELAAISYVIKDTCDKL